MKPDEKWMIILMAIVRIPALIEMTFSSKQSVARYVI
jgi:hypothetical protein